MRRTEAAALLRLWLRRSCRLSGHRLLSRLLPRLRLLLGRLLSLLLPGLGGGLLYGLLGWLLPGLWLLLSGLRCRLLPGLGGLLGGLLPRRRGSGLCGRLGHGRADRLQLTSVNPAGPTV
jgi:hypothetical protein